MHGLADENPISEDNFDRYAERVQTPGIEIRRNRTPVEGEGRSHLGNSFKVAICCELTYQ
jgi:hypothetical protein